jgi:hypothetical protein
MKKGSIEVVTVNPSKPPAQAARIATLRSLTVAREIRTTK